MSDHAPKEKTWRGNYCCVPLCRNSSGQREEREHLGLQRISFHSFPTDDKMKKEWIVQIRRDPGINFTVNKHTKVCSEHFGPIDFVATISGFPTARARLQSNAIPSLFPCYTEACKHKSCKSSTVNSFRYSFFIYFCGTRFVPQLLPFQIVLFLKTNYTIS